jgi:multidrug resistance protein, MATE family
MNRKILKLSIPSILANITVPLVGMVDIAVAGRLGNVAAIGAIAIGTMLFDLLYWNFGFLRVGTGGLTAQSYGRRNFSDAIKYFTQGITTAIGSAVVLILIQWLFVEFAFLLIDCSPEVEALSREYFFIRIWAAPATLSLFVFKGWFIGMQNTISPMLIDILVNVVNFVVSVYLGLFTPLGFAGIAYGTLIAQYSGLILASLLTLIYYKKIFKYFDIKKSLKLKDMKSFYVVNSNLFIRSICFLFIYSGFTTIAAKYGDTMLAVSSIIMKLLMLYSYFIDGFAYAGEALTGKYIGAKDRKSLSVAVKYLFIWSGAIGIVSTIAYILWSEEMVRFLSNDPIIIEASKPFFIWLILMPIFSCAAFMWDGIFIGATASTSIRNGMIFSCIGFYLVYFALKGSFGIQSLYFAYFAHLIVRAVYMTFSYKREVNLAIERVNNKI